VGRPTDGRDRLQARIDVYRTTQNTEAGVRREVDRRISRRRHHDVPGRRHRRGTSPAVLRGALREGYKAYGETCRNDRDELWCVHGQWTGRDQLGADRVAGANRRHVPGGVLELLAARGVMTGRPPDSGGAAGPDGRERRSAVHLFGPGDTAGPPDGLHPNPAGDRRMAKRFVVQRPVAWRGWTDRQGVGPAGLWRAQIARSAQRRRRRFTYRAPLCRRVGLPIVKFSD
jgi:hypothetical protein